MAKRKTPKVKKPSNITNDQLHNMQDIINDLNRAQIEVGSIESRKHSLLHHVGNVQEKLAKMQEELKKEYGTDNINIHTGAINYDENGKAN